MNTINSLAFAHGSEKVFVSGTRDGCVRIFDTRCVERPTLSFKAHTQKLNSAAFNSLNTALLTSARDSLIRLWDVRKLAVSSKSLSLP